jgi:TetR/AcrR family transcriptional regulator
MSQSIKSTKKTRRRPGPATRRSKTPATSAKAAPTGPRPAQADGLDRDTEQRILDAAHAVFVRHGTAGARMQDIAAEAGANQALLHYYFRTKDRLSEAVFRRAAGQLLPRVFEVMASDAPLEEKVVRVVHLEIDVLRKAPYLPGYIISELHHHPERVRQLVGALTGLTPEDVRPKVVTTLRRQLEAGAQAGSLRAIEPDQFIVNLVSLCIFPFAARPMIMALLGLDQHAFDRFIDRRRDQLAAFFLGALRP